jgi:hypothetical protein
MNVADTYTTAEIDAFKRVALLTPNDEVAFETTTFEVTRSCITDIEIEQGKTRHLMDLRRVKRFLSFLQQLETIFQSLEPSPSTQRVSFKIIPNTKKLMGYVWVCVFPRLKC